MRDLLALCPDLPPDPALRYAAGLSRLLGAALSGLQVCEPIVTLESTAMSAATSMVAAWTQDCLARARQAGTDFDRWAAQAGLEHARWLVAQGNVSETVAQLAHWHDLLVIERNDNWRWGTVNALGQLLLGGGLPLLALPPGHAQPARLDLVAVAWNGAPESTRALHAALPLLQRAGSVLLMTGQRRAPFSEFPGVPVFDPVSWLESHGVRFSHCLLEGPQAQDGGELLARATDQHADLLVMGGYGRTRFAEWILGGATRHVLLHARMPVLLRH